MGIRERIFGAKEKPEERALAYSVGDPAFAEFLELSRGGLYGYGSNQESALGITAIFRAVAIISGTIAGLPLKTYREKDGNKERISSFLDNPAGPYPLSPFAWKELVMVHLLLQGEVFLLHIYNGAGQLVGLWPIHRSFVEVELKGYEKYFTLTLDDNSKKLLTSAEMTHVMGLTLDGVRGIAPLTLFRQTIKLGLSGEHAAMRVFQTGAFISGLVTPDTDITEDEAKAIKIGLQKKVGLENAGDIAVVNRALKFTPWAMTNEDAQFIQSREFQITEVARLFGVPPHLLAQTEKQTSWGSGVAEQNLGLARYTLMNWTSRLEEPLSSLLPAPRFVEFDYSGLLQGSPKDEIELLLAQVQGGLLTLDEARAIRNLPPLPKQGQTQVQDQGGEKVVD